MAVRSFNGTSDYIVHAAGALSAMTHGTVAFLVKVPSGAPQTGHIVFAWVPEDDSDNGDTGLAYDGGTSLDLYFWDGATFRSADLGANRLGVWHLVVWRKNSGSAAVRYSVYNFDAETWTHGSFSGNNGNLTPIDTDGTIWIGHPVGAFSRIEIAARAAWVNSLPWSADSTGDSAIEAAGLETALQSWFDADPDALWAFNQASTATAVNDIIGDADQVDISGTSVITDDDPPGFSFDLDTGGGDTITGTAESTLGALTAAATGTPTTLGTAATTLGSLDATATGTRETFGAASSTTALTGTASGTRETFGSASIALGALTGDASGTPTTFGSATGNLGALNGSATGSRETFGSASTDLGELVAEAMATAAGQGFAEATLGGLLAAATGRRSTTGAAQSLLGALTATAEGFLAETVFGTATAILGGLTATATGGGNLVDLISVADIEEAIGREAFSAEEEAQWMSYIKMVSSFIQSKVRVGFSQTTIEATYQADSYGQVSLWEPVVDIEWVRNFRTGNDDLWVDWDGVNKLMYLEPHQTIKVRYTYGYSAVPDDIKQLATTLTMAQINEIGIPGGLRRYKIGDVEEQYNDSVTTKMLDQMTNDVLDNYRRVWYSIPISVDVFPDYQPQGFATDFDDE